jgi:hypothetical protein
MSWKEFCSSRKVNGRIVKTSLGLEAGVVIDSDLYCDGSFQQRFRVVVPLNCTHNASNTMELLCLRKGPRRGPIRRREMGKCAFSGSGSSVS